MRYVVALPIQHRGQTAIRGARIIYIPRYYNYNFNIDTRIDLTSNQYISLKILKNKMRPHRLPDR